ncbi:XcbB/CpsF family capsular polysaccharide biosynthesis protein [Alysiella filiformis]|uniref:XcbB/CpsF family capsular polysaccharide biosynthesis protein n=1 Tax=Alysiella filiformis DSM 16848 TaxID=1120981 RepID=A0A286ECX8_9NEIS|nr:XcbB/CpsF family capsular polysaccharide biosynthesis protein [Alysiella filiformis]QMT31899.1 XcbB/CpsF family capsular polysaccharide biosynthesis protein [Alysiella filiformis]UBQ57195.1 XcbB/CpsF family capsular polysaccharide biosynthesis protein [Alysiella filiformis DSM 16848]SOD68719.1 hypothetical protein SAMN02746062_01370 [Alysiella filiformis DSM 16848]
MDLHQIQNRILNTVQIDTSKIHAWIYNNQSIVFDFLVNDYFISISYATQGQSFNLIERNKSRIGTPSHFSKLVEHLTEKYRTYPQSQNQEKTLWSFKLIEDDWAKIEEKFCEILTNIFAYMGNKLCHIFNVEKNQEIHLSEYLDNPQIEYIGIKGNSNDFFLSYARNHNLSDYVYLLNQKGFLAVEHKMGVSVFRRINKNSYQDLLPYFSDSFHELENVIYTIEAPKLQNAKQKNLLILFSYTNKSNENMIDRYYSHPFPFIANSIMPNTYIIRMADVADAFGSHGLNTQFDENIEDNIQKFIKRMMNIYDIDKENVVICGASSGGTGAVYHGLIGGYKTFAIDPFLGNHDYYGGKDPLYLHSIRQPIAETFRTLPHQINQKLANQVVISTAKVSEFYQDIHKLKAAIPELILCQFDCEKIGKHIDFSNNTVFMSNTIINSLLMGLNVNDVDISL